MPVETERANGPPWAFDDGTLYFGIGTRGRGARQRRGLATSGTLEVPRFIEKVHALFDASANPVEQINYAAALRSVTEDWKPQTRGRFFSWFPRPALFGPSDVRDLSRKEVEKIQPSPVSLMPPGLLDSCKAEEVADMVAWLLSGSKR